MKMKLWRPLNVRAWGWGLAVYVEVRTRPRAAALHRSEYRCDVAGCAWETAWTMNDDTSAAFVGVVFETVNHHRAAHGQPPIGAAA